MSFLLSASLDRKAIHADFIDQGYAQIASVLPKETAGRIHKGLLEQTSWSLVFNDNDKHIDLPQAQLSIMESKDLIRLKEAIYAQAKNNFQYCYSNYPIYDAYKAGLNEGHVLHQF